MRDGGDGVEDGKEVISEARSCRAAQKLSQSFKSVAE